MSLSCYMTTLTQLLTTLQCNEVHPVCGGCQRHGVVCIYTNPTLKTPVDREAKNAPKSAPAKAATNSNVEYPESNERRLLELRLLTQWVTKSAFTFPGSEEKDYREGMLLGVPNHALKFPAWLYCIFAFSAIHIAKTSAIPAEQREFMDSFRKYLDLSLQEHRRDVDDLCKEKANAICITSSLIRNCMQAIFQDRDLVPYSPPAQWLHMSHGSGDVFKTAWDWVSEDKASLAWRLGTTGPDLSDLKELFAERKREGFVHLLNRRPADVKFEPWDTETQRAYELTLSFIGGIQIAIDEGERPSHTFRRIIAFPMFTPKRYIELVEEAQPRALLILAYYFSFLSRLRGIWWIGDAGRREIRAIQSVLESPWVEQLEWPINKMEEVWDIRPWQYY
jgi:hypothetical protein